jgi:hypothetical protein
MPGRKIRSWALTAAIGAAGIGALCAGVREGRADLIELKDGRKISGSMVRQGDVMVIKADDGTTVTAKPSDVMKVTLTNTVSPAEAAEADWTRLTQQTKTADDLQKVIEGLQKFVDKYPEGPRAQDAKNQLGMYQMLAANNAVKFRGNWMPRAQIEVKLKQWAEAARPALDLYRQGRLKETIEAVRAVLAADDQNPDALAIGGLAAYRSNTLGQARTFFSQLAAADPSSVLGLNNLAVVAWQQRAQPEALIHYTKALQAKPDNRLLLDNIAEAINTYVGDKNSPAYRNLLRQYEPAETRMEAELAKAGLLRWGSTWVGKDQYEKLTKNRNTVQDHMARLDAQYRVAQQTLSNFDQQVQAAQDDYNRAVANVNYFNAAIQQAQQLGQDTTLLVAQRQAAVQTAEGASRVRQGQDVERAKLEGVVEEYKAQAGRLKAALEGAQPAYTGQQRIMELGEDVTPPPPPAVPTPPELGPLPQTIIVTPPPVVQPSPPVYVPVPVPVYVDPDGRGGGGRGGRGGRGGPGEGHGGEGDPTTRPTTAPVTRPVPAIGEEDQNPPATQPVRPTPPPPVLLPR